MLTDFVTTISIQTHILSQVKFVKLVRDGHLECLYSLLHAWIILRF